MRAIRFGAIVIVSAGQVPEPTTDNSTFLTKIDGPCWLIALAISKVDTSLPTTKLTSPSISPFT